VFRARLVIVFLTVIFTAINAHFFWTVEITSQGYGYEYYNVTDVCYATSGFHHLAGIWPWVDAAIYSFIPLLTITVLNILIIRQVSAARRLRQHLENADNDDVRFGRWGAEGSAKLTVMLLSVSFTFLLTTLPLNITLIVTFLEGENPSNEHIAREALLQTITELLMYVNHSINFFLYCATGIRFRRKLVNILTFRKAKVKKSRQRRVSENGFRLTNFKSMRYV
jgi:hypothetical protein